MKVAINSDNKVTVHDKCSDFDLVTSLEVVGDTLTLVMVNYLYRAILHAAYILN